MVLNLLGYSPEDLCRRIGDRPVVPEIVTIVKGVQKESGTELS